MLEIENNLFTLRIFLELIRNLKNFLENTIIILIDFAFLTKDLFSLYYFHW